MEFEFTNVQGQRRTLEGDKLIPPDNYMKLLDADGNVKFLVNPNAIAFVEAKTEAPRPQIQVVN